MLTQRLLSMEYGFVFSFNIPLSNHIIARNFLAIKSAGKGCRFDLAVVDVTEEEVAFICEGKKPELGEEETRMLLVKTFVYIRRKKNAYAMYGTGDRVSSFVNIGSDHMWCLNDPNNLASRDESLHVFYIVGEKRSTANISLFLRKVKARVDTAW